MPSAGCSRPGDPGGHIRKHSTHPGVPPPRPPHPRQRSENQHSHSHPVHTPLSHVQKPRGASQEVVSCCVRKEPQEAFPPSLERCPTVAQRGLQVPSRPPAVDNLPQGLASLILEEFEKPGSVLSLPPSPHCLFTQQSLNASVFKHGGPEGAEQRLGSRETIKAEVCPPSQPLKFHFVSFP